MARLDWKGGDVRRKVALACAVGIDATMAEAVRLAKADHAPYPPSSAPGERFHSRMAFLEGSIQIFDEAIPSNEVWIAGSWGAEANYSLYVELGTSRKASGAPRAQMRARSATPPGMYAIPGPAVPPLMAARYTLRPAAVEAYMLLGANIAAAYNAGG